MEQTRPIHHVLKVLIGDIGECIIDYICYLFVCV